LLAGYAFHFRLIPRLLAALEVVPVFFGLYAHIVVELYAVLDANVIHLERVLALQIEHAVALAQHRRTHILILIESVLISHVDLLPRLHVSQIAEVLALLQLEDPGLRQLSLLRHQFKVVVETLPHLVLAATAEERVHLVVGQSIDLKQEAEGVRVDHLIPLK
jgi:hypothetical protein